VDLFRVSSPDESEDALREQANRAFRKRKSRSTPSTHGKKIEDLLDLHSFQAAFPYTGAWSKGGDGTWE
jgi:hypothetical protein